MIDELKCNLRIKLRLAVYTDVNSVLSWRNEPATVLNMKTKRVLNFQEHNHWFKKTIIDPNCVFLIIEADQEPIGQLRYELENQMAKVSINITEKWHGKGVASKAFYLGSLHIKNVNFSKTVFARVLKSNAGSIRAMANAGFKIINEISYEGEPHYYMSHDLNEFEV